MSEQKSILDVLNEAGVTKHVGGLKATRRLGSLCRLDEKKIVLDVGSGIGISPCFLAKEFGSRVIGIDILENMVNISTQRAKKKHIDHKVEFKLADAHRMPFEDNYFDAAISEDAILIMKDKPAILKECARVTKPGGFVGLSCATWVKTPPQKMKEEASLFTEVYDADTWKSMMETAGLVDLVAEVNQVTPFGEFVEQFKWIGLRDFFSVFGKLVSAARPFMNKTSFSSKDIAEYVGYGTYIGKKP